MAAPRPGHGASRSAAGVERRQEKRRGCGSGSTPRAGTIAPNMLRSQVKGRSQHICANICFCCQNFDSVTFLPLFISFICLETQTAKIISRLALSSDFTGAAACSVALLLGRLRQHSWRKQGRCSPATYNPPRSSHGCRATNEACVDTRDLSHKPGGWPSIGREAASRRMLSLPTRAPFLLPAPTLGPTSRTHGRWR